MEEKLIKELNKLNSRAFKTDFETERIQVIEDELLELQDMSYECLNELSE